jgi:hypothetical protein
MNFIAPQLCGKTACSSRRAGPVPRGADVLFVVDCASRAAGRENGLRKGRGRDVERAEKRGREEDREKRVPGISSGAAALSPSCLFGQSCGLLR